MKKLLPALLVVVMLLGAVSCHEKPDDPGTDLGTETMEQTPNVPKETDLAETTVPEPSSPEIPESDPPSSDMNTPEAPKTEIESSGTITPPEAPKTETESSGAIIPPEAPKTEIESSGTIMTAPLVITSHPQDAEAAAGETVVFYVAVSGGTAPYQYKWMLKDAGSGWRTASGGTTDTLERMFSTPELDSGLEFCCEITDTGGLKVVSNAAKVSKKTVSAPESPVTPEPPTTPETPTEPEAPGLVLPEKQPIPLKITSQPVDASGKVGETVKFSVAVSGGKAPYTYRWEGKNDLIRNWNPLTNGGQSEIALTVAVNARDSFRCVITDSEGNEVITNSVKITVIVDSAPAETFRITEQPVSVSGDEGEKVQLRVTAAGGKTPYSYQWLMQNSFSGVWQPVKNGNDSALSVDIATGKGRYYCMITDAEGTTLDSDEVQVTMKAAPTPPEAEPLKIVKQPEEQLTRKNEVKEFAFTVEVSGGKAPFFYQWYFRLGDGFEWEKSSGYNSDERSNTGEILCDTYQFVPEVYCVVTDDDGKSVQTDTVRILLAQTGDITITAHPQDVEKNPSGQYTFSVTFTGTGAPFTCRWQSRPSGADWSDIALHKLNKAGTSTVPMALGSHTQVRCVVVDANGNETASEIARVIEKDSLAITSQPTYAKALDGMQVVYKVAVSGGKSPYTYQWQAYQSLAGGSPMWWDLASSGDRWKGADTDKLTWTVSNADGTDGIRIRCIITDADGNSVTSEEVPIM